MRVKCRVREWCEQQTHLSEGGALERARDESLEHTGQCEDLLHLYPHMSHVNILTEATDVMS